MPTRGWLHMPKRPAGAMAFSCTAAATAAATTAQAPLPLTASEQASIDRFCEQCLQLEPRPRYPDGHLLKRAHVQDAIFDRICARHDARQQPPPPGNQQLQLRVLKELVVRIQASISDDEVHDYEVSDRIMDRVGQLVAVPRVPDLELAESKCLVTYTLPPLAPPLAPPPASPQIQMRENRNLLAVRGGSGHRTWAAALYLSHFLCATHASRALVAGKRVLELGAGTGFLTILCAKHLGAAHVTASEGNAEVLAGMADNLALNGCRADGPGSSVTPVLLKWGGHVRGARPVDTILGADITYDRNANPALVSTLRQLLDRYPRADVVLSVTERNMTTLSLFREACRQSQLCVHVRQDAVGHVPDEENMAFAPFYRSSAPIRIYRVARVEENTREA